MKKYLYLILLIFPLLSFANCIEFNGRYKCSSSEGSTQRFFTTEIDDGVYIYEFAEDNHETMTFFADGLARPFELTEEGMKIIGMITSQCSSNALNSHFTGRLEGDSGKVKINMQTSQDEGKISNVIEIFYNGMQIQTVEETCVPL
ncbi:MAG: hypothetical protein E2O68_00470 [Deltaproteobacteria bacterium]|nr:MAG: hypothetical protein E2O68_00470 [Deltaproteobacteria bacterium]